MDGQVVQFIKDRMDNQDKQVSEFKAEVKTEFVSLNTKLDSLLEAKWKIHGGSIVVSILVSAAFSIAIASFFK